MACENAQTEYRWYAMRDLSRSNAKSPAYKVLADMQYEIFTPMTRRLVVKNGHRVSREVPFLQDLLFVHATREQLNSAVAKIANLQYRYIRGGYCEPMVVRDADMERFIHAVQSSAHPHYYTPQEVNASMRGRRVRIIGGVLDGYEGELLKVRGSRVRRLLVEMPNLLSAGIELTDCEYVML